MAKSLPKIVLSEQRAIPLDKLVLSQSNVRQVKAGVAIEQLAEDIARRTLLQSLTVRAVVDEAGRETGMFEVPAGGRRGERQAQLIDHLKKVEMAERAQALLTGTGWLPEPLRTPGRELLIPVESAAEPIVVTDAIEPESTVEETAADDGEPAMGEFDDFAEDEPVAEADAPYAYAAE